MARYKKKINLGNKIIRNSRNRNSISIKIIKKIKIRCLKTDCDKKKQDFSEKKLSETINKPKELWESIKSLGMQTKQ